jgi:hypothetical protein
MTLFPAIRAATIWPMKMDSGKFQGLMQRNIPRLHHQPVFLSRRARKHDSVFIEQAFSLCSVVSAEIDRFAHFADSVLERFPPLELQQSDKSGHLVLNEVRHPTQHFRPLEGWYPRPFMDPLASGKERVFQVIRARFPYLGYDFVSIAWAQVGAEVLRCCFPISSPAVDDR